MAAAGARERASSGGVALNGASLAVRSIAPECRDTFNQLKIRRKHRWVEFGIVGEQMQVLATAGTAATAEELVEQLPEKDCRFYVLDQVGGVGGGRVEGGGWARGGLGTGGDS